MLFAENHDILPPYPKAKRKEISSYHSIIQTPDRETCLREEENSSTTLIDIVVTHVVYNKNNRMIAISNDYNLSYFTFC